MNYSPYDLKTRPASEHPLENPTNPEEIPSLEYPSREEPGRFYADKTKPASVDDTDEEQVSENASRDGVEQARQSSTDMDFEDDDSDEPVYEGADELAVHSGPGLRH